MYCEHCGSEILNGEKYCYNCGAPAPQPTQTPPRDNQRINQQQAVYPEPVVVNAPKQMPTYNGLANASFILGIVALALGWVPILDIILLIASTAVSIIALIKIKNGKNNWKPITALVLTVISFVVGIATIY